MEYRKCKVCEKEFPETNFRLRKYKNKRDEIVSSYGNICLNCTHLSAAEYRKNNKDKIKIRVKKYRESNKEKIKIQNREWHKNNPEKSRAIKRRKESKRRKKYINKLRAHVSRQINFALHRLDSSKCGESVLKYLPYTIEELKQHIENQFEPWMSWNNYGNYKLIWNDIDPSTWTWQIDHIIPQCKLPYDNMEHDNFKKCWSLSNLRPLSAKQNCLDGARKNEN